MMRFLYTLSVAVSLAVLSTTTLCAEPTIGALEFGEVSGQPGEIVDVPVFATFGEPLTFFAVFFQFDPERLEFVRFTVEGTAASGVDPLALAFRTYDPGDGLFGIFLSGPAKRAFRVPPGDRISIGKLQFQVRATAPEGVVLVKPVKSVAGTHGETGLMLDVGNDFVSRIPQPLIEGRVTVLAPEGPRPLGDFLCEQFLDRVNLSFSLTETYDEIVVSRDGTPIATLPGTATSMTDKLPGAGAFTYSVVARREGESSLAVKCEVLAVSPAAPPVEDFSCGDDGLSWTNPVSYDRLLIFKDNELLAQLPGDAASYVDSDRRESLTLYSIVGELEGFPSPEINCLDHGIWIMEVGDVQVPLDADRVLIPIFVTTSFAVQAMDFCLDVDSEHFEFIEDLEAGLRGTVGYPEPEYFDMTANGGGCGKPAAGLAYDLFQPDNREKDLPVGLRQHVMNFVFQPKGAISEGDAFVVSLDKGDFVDTSSWEPDTYISGEVRFGSAGLATVEDLQAAVGDSGEGAGEGAAAAEPGGSRVVLSWRNTSPYDNIRIERDGTVVAEIPGQETQYEDPDVPAGIFTYKVVGVHGGKTTFPASTLVSTVLPRGAFLRGDTTRDGAITITDPVATLSFLFLGGKSLPCEDAADADDDGQLTVSDPIVTLHYLFLGDTVIRAPGVAHEWFDPTADGLTCLK